MTFCFLRTCAILVVALCVCAPVFGQDEEGAESTVCDLCVCVTDVTCSSPEQACTNESGCSFVSFTPPCDGNYTFDVKVICPANCDNCFACGYLQDTVTGTIRTLQGGCGINCSSTMSVTLVGGRSYKLWACLRSCNNNCEDCAECTARARVYQTSDDCAAPCN